MTGSATTLLRLLRKLRRVAVRRSTLGRRRKQSSFLVCGKAGLLRFARNDGDYGRRITRSRDEPATATKASLACSSEYTAPDLIGNGFRCPLPKPGASSRSTAPVAIDDSPSVSMPT